MQDRLGKNIKINDKVLFSIKDSETLSVGFVKKILFDKVEIELYSKKFIRKGEDIVVI